MNITVRDALATAVVFIAAIGCIRLGFWQLDRLEQRRQRNRALEARIALAPVSWPAVPGDSSGWLQRRVLVRGTFDHERSIVLPGRAYQGVPGAHVLTPIVLTNGQAVLADRGWVPAADGASVQLDSLPPVGVTVDTALVLPFPGQERRLGSTDGSTDGSTVPSDKTGEFRRVWFSLDERALRAQFPYQLGSVHVQLLPSTSAPRIPVRQPLPELSEGSHLGYAIQWFSFAIIAVVGWIVLVLRARRTGPRHLRLHMF